jgi:hypothetical protein
MMLWPARCGVPGALEMLDRADGSCLVGETRGAILGS